MKRALVLVFLLAGCASEQQEREAYAPKYVDDFFLQDGTRCVWVTGVRRAGLSCDWQPPLQEGEGDD